MGISYTYHSGESKVIILLAPVISASHRSVCPWGLQSSFLSRGSWIIQSHFQGMAEDALAEKISMISVPQVWDSTWLPLYTPVCVVIPSCFKHVCGLFVQLVALGVVMASSRLHFWMMPSTVRFITLCSATA